jgi:hypothetical protein
VVGPVSAVGAAVVPVAAGIARGERPGVLAVAGALVALPAIVLVAASGSVRGRLGSGLFDGIVAGLAFGILFIGLAQAGTGACGRSRPSRPVRCWSRWPSRSPHVSR